MDDAAEFRLGEDGDGVLHGIGNVDVLSHSLHGGDLHGKAADLVGSRSQNEQQIAVLVVLEHTSGLQIQAVDASVVVDVDVHHLGGVVLVGGGVIDRVQVAECHIQRSEQVISGRVHLFHTVRLRGRGLCYRIDKALFVNVKAGDACRHVTGRVGTHLIGGEQVPEVVRHHLCGCVHGVRTEIALEFAVAVEHGRAVGDVVQHHIDVAGFVRNDFLGLKGLIFIQGRVRPFQFHLHIAVQIAHQQPGVSGVCDVHTLGLLRHIDALRIFQRGLAVLGFQLVINSGRL